MATFSKVLFSGSTDGQPVKVVATATAGTLIHTADATALDEIWLWVVNNSSNDATLTVEFGGVAIDQNIPIFVRKDVGPLLVVNGVPLTNSLVMRAFSSLANDLNVFGFVNRITP